MGLFLIEGLLRIRSCPVAGRRWVLVYLCILFCLSDCVGGLRRHSDGVRGPPDPLHKLEKKWRTIMDDDNALLGIGRSPGARLKRSTVRELGDVYTQYLSMLIPFHWDLDDKDIDVSEVNVPDENGNLPTDEKNSKEMGNVLASLFEFIEEYPEIPRDTETLVMVSEMDKSMLHNGIPLKEKPSFTTMVDMASMYNGNTLMEVLMKASDTGNARAQNILASVYATGVLHGDEGLVPLDAGRSLVLHYMSALSGNPEANIAMGYRYANGIGVQESCPKSLQHYEYAANVAIDTIDKRGFPLHSEKAYLSHEEKTTRAPSTDSNPEVLQYYRHLVDEGDQQAAINLGRVYMHGNKLLDQDMESGLQFLKVASDSGSATASGQLGYALAQGLGGKYRQKFEDYEIAELLRYSSSRGDPYGVLGYGYVFMKGIGVERNHTRAFELFSKVASKHPDAHFFMGEMLAGYGGVLVDAETQEARKREVIAEADELLERGAQLHAAGDNEELKVTPEMFYKLMMQSRAQGGRQISIPKGLRLADKDLKTVAAQAAAVEQRIHYKTDPDYAAAIRSYSSAAQRGHVSALHRLSHMTKLGLGTSVNCVKAVQGFRAIAEAGDWGHKLTVAHRKFTYGTQRDQQIALRLFARLAPLGYETAQYNAAHLLSRRVQPGWYRVSKDTTNEVTSGSPPSRARRHLGATAPRDVSLSWLSWSPWKFAQSGIPEPPTRLLTRERGPSEDRRILEHNRQAHKLKSSVSFAASKAEDNGNGGNNEVGGRDSLTVGSSNSAGSVPFTERVMSFGFDIVRSIFSGEQTVPLLLKSLSLLMGQGQVDSMEAVNSRRDSEARALNLYALSAGQGNSDAHLRLGDFHYYGLGWLEVDKIEAASFYQNAADLHHTHAIFNLGVMHEIGDGVKQDFHLAKRFYDQAAEFNTEARVPRSIALFVLQAHQYYDTSLRDTWFGRTVESGVEFFTNVYSQAQAVTRGRLRDTRTLSAALFSEFPASIGYSSLSSSSSSSHSTSTVPSTPHNPGSKDVPAVAKRRRPFFESLVESPIMGIAELLRTPDGWALGPRQFLYLIVGRTQWHTLEERRDERRMFWLQVRSQKAQRDEQQERAMSQLEYSLKVSKGMQLYTDYTLYHIADAVHANLERIIMGKEYAEDFFHFLLRDALVEGWPSRIWMWLWRWIIVITMAIPHYLLRDHIQPLLGMVEGDMFRTPALWLVPELWIDMFSFCLILITVTFTSRYRYLLNYPSEEADERNTRALAAGQGARMNPPPQPQPQPQPRPQGT